MSKYDIRQVMKTKCDTLFEIKELVADFFINNRDEEEVTVNDDKLGKFEFSIYDSDIVHNINLQMQIAHFGGTLESADSNGISIKEQSYNSSMSNIKPTMRDVRVVLNALGLKHDKYHFNDKRVHGGRIKLYGTSFAFEDLPRIRYMMEQLFPGFAFDVYNWKARRYNGPVSTCIKWEH